LSEGAVDLNPRSSNTILGALSALYDRRWLALYFTKRQLVQSYRGSFLGLAWLIVGPLLMAALYTLVFSEIIGLRFGSTDSASNFGLYIYCGLLPFLAFSETVTKSTNAVRSNAVLVQRVVFPLEILPFATAVTALLTQLFGFIALLGLVMLFGGGLHTSLLYLPLIVLPQIAFLLGLGLLATTAGAYLPDLRELLGAIVRVMLFATPILWPADQVPDHLRFLVVLNPLAFLVEGYRDIVLEGTLPSLSALAAFSAFSVALMTLGVVVFVKAKAQFADLV
jgi:ABC-2 type transport system permease protein